MAAVSKRPRRRNSRCACPSRTAASYTPATASLPPPAQHAARDSASGSSAARAKAEQQLFAHERSLRSLIAPRRLPSVPSDLVDEVEKATNRAETLAKMVGSSLAAWPAATEVLLATAARRVDGVMRRVDAAKNSGRTIPPEMALKIGALLNHDLVGLYQLMRHLPSLVSPGGSCLVAREGAEWGWHIRRQRLRELPAPTSLSNPPTCQLPTLHCAPPPPPPTGVCAGCAGRHLRGL